MLIPKAQVVARDYWLPRPSSTVPGLVPEMHDLVTFRVKYPRYPCFKSLKPQHEKRTASDIHIFNVVILRKENQNSREICNYFLFRRPASCPLLAFSSEGWMHKCASALVSQIGKEKKRCNVEKPFENPRCTTPDLTRHRNCHHTAYHEVSSFVQNSKIFRWWCEARPEGGWLPNPCGGERAGGVFIDKQPASRSQTSPVCVVV